MAKKVKFVVHPVSPELKEELRNQGFKIVDARFAPKGEEVFNPHEKPKAASGGKDKK